MILDLTNAVSRKPCKIGAKLVLIINRKSHMSFRLVPNSVTLDDLERRNSHNHSVISLNSVPFGAAHVEVVEDIPIPSATEMYAKESSFRDISFMAILAGDHLQQKH